MAYLRDSYQAAENQEQDDEDYGYVYGTNVSGYDNTDPEVSSGWTYEGAPEAPAKSPEMSVKLGPLFTYDSQGKQVYSDPEVSSGWTYGGKETVTSEPTGSFSPSTTPSGSGNFNWATPYNKAASAATGLKSGITTSQKPYATVQTSKTVYPSGSQFPTFKGPSWDDKEIKKRTQKAAAPGLRAMEMKVAQAMARYYENPNVRRMVLRDTLAGYGIGIANIRAQAGQQARAEYGQEYSRMYSEAMNDFNRQIAKLESQSTKVSSQQQVYTKAEYDKLTGGSEKLDTLA